MNEKRQRRDEREIEITLALREPERLQINPRFDHEPLDFHIERLALSLSLDPELHGEPKNSDSALPVVRFSVSHHRHCWVR